MPKSNRNIKALHVNVDKNECFVLRKCILYLQSLVSAETILDKEIFHILAWVLGDRFKTTEKQLYGMLSKKELGKYQSDIDTANTLDNSIDLIRKILYTSPKIRIIKFISLIQRSLAARDKAIPRQYKSDIEKRILKLAKILNLTQDDIKFCTFLYITKAWHQSEEYFVSHLKCNTLSGRRYLKAVLEMTESRINTVLSGNLVKIELCAIKNNGFAITDTFAELLIKPSTGSLESKYFRRIIVDASLMNNQSVDPQKTEYILALLSAKRKSPTHILLHGASGSGKTSFAYNLTKELRIPSYEVARNENKVGERKAAMTACINATKKKNAIIIIDNADDLLKRKYDFFKDAEEDKSWLIQFLKKPATKFIWIVNSIDKLDPAVLKYFSFSLQFKPINERQRISTWKSILNKHRLKNSFSDEELKELSSTYPVNTDIINLSVKTAKEMTSLGNNEFKDNLRLDIEGRMELLGNKPNNKDKIENNYSLEGLNIEGDLQDIMQQIKAFDKFLQDGNKSLTRNFNMLFYGPPGTGKSELARYIGQYLDKEITCKRASDIVSPYVGETEQNISKVFRKTEGQDAILIIDEADSFLYKREWATRSWEISHTNEFLTQMERFRGILICTTNMLCGLDSASIRRFNHKIKFDYLSPTGNVIFYQRFLESLIGDQMDKKTEEILRRIKQLTPGDFRVVRDRYSFYPSQRLNHHLLVESLIKEASVKRFQREGGRRIGF
jgi:SpoVK/Ycf46/Vps4 family AAA+-type ATPase